MKRSVYPLGSVVMSLSFSLACGGQVGEESGAECAAVESIPLDRGETSPLGFSAGEVLDAIGPERVLTLDWANDTTTVATVSLSSQTGEIQFHDREVINSGGLEAAIGCDDDVEIPLTVTFSTDDGAFAETWQQSIFATVSDSARFTRNLDLVSGSFDLTPFVPEGDWDTVRSWVSLRIDADAGGEITGQAAGEEGEVAFAENFTIATLRSGEGD